MPDAKRLPKHLFLRGGIYYVKVKIKGRQYWRSTGYGVGALRSAERKADEIKVRLRNQVDFAEPKLAPTFGEWADTYERTYTPRKRDRWRDRHILEPARRAWSRLRLDEITKSRAVAYLDSRPVSPSTRKRERGTLQAVFERAREDGLIAQNPFRTIPREPDRVRARILTEQDEPKLRAQLSPAEDRWLTFMLGTGLRLEEARGIYEHSLDWKQSLIEVPEEFAKWGRARTIPMFRAVREVLHEQLREEGELWHAPTRRLQWRLARAAKRAGIPHLSPHDLRHTFATRLLRKGVDIYTVSRLLGHSSVKVTERHYIHLLPKDLHSLVRRVADGGALPPEGGKPEENPPPGEPW